MCGCVWVPPTNPTPYRLQRRLDSCAGAPQVHKHKQQHNHKNECRGMQAAVPEESVQKMTRHHHA